jgi:hypothetical protein
MNLCDPEPFKKSFDLHRAIESTSTFILPSDISAAVMLSSTRATGVG